MAKLAPVQQQTPAFPSQGILYDLAGLEVDATGWVWRLNHPVRRYTLDFHRLKIEPGPMLTAIAAYIADRIADASPDHVRNSFDNLPYLDRKSVV